MADRTVIEALPSAFDAQSPSSEQGDGLSDNGSRLRRLALLYWIGVPLLACYSVANLAFGRVFAGCVDLSSFLALCASLFVGKRLGHSILASHIALAGLMVTIGFSPLFENLIYSQTLWFAPIIPLSAAVLLGRRAAYVYLAVCAFVICSVFVYDAYFDPVESRPYMLFDWVILRLMALLSAWAVTSVSNRESARRLKGVQEQQRAMNQALDEAEAANRAKSLFLANMSHEIRNPMNGILGTAEYLKGTKLSAEDSDAISTIVRCGEHLLGLIDDVLDLSKIESGELEIQNQDMDLSELIEHCVSLFRAKAQAANVDLQLVQPQEAVHLRGDRKRLSQVLANLIGNAIKFSDAGVVKVEVQLGPSENASRALQISVSDQGIGIRPEKLAVLFEEFEQVDDSDGKERGGSGLGLAISRYLVQQMGGDIEVESTFGEGSTFRLLMQLDECSHDSGRLRPQTQLSGVQRAHFQARVLVVDDQPINLKLAKLLLEKLGCEVTQAQDGREAVACCSQESFDLIFMDIRMPVMNGLEASLLIIETPGPNQQTPIIALTACAFEEDREASLSVGMREHISKPLRRAQLSKILDKYLLNKTIKARSA